MTREYPERAGEARDIFERLGRELILADPETRERIQTYLEGLSYGLEHARKQRQAV